METAQKKWRRFRRYKLLVEMVEMVEMVEGVKFKDGERTEDHSRCATEASCTPDLTMARGTSSKTLSPSLSCRMKKRNSVAEYARRHIVLPDATDIMEVVLRVVAVAWMVDVTIVHW